MRGESRVVSSAHHPSKLSKGVVEVATYREMPCEFYICKGQCSKGKRDAEHNGRCQTCSKYHPRAKVHTVNKKKLYNEKARGKIKY
jgi:hypothetical protein